MSPLIRFWQRLPVIVRAVLSGSLVAMLGNLPWGILAYANLKLTPRVPWSVPLMIFYLWFFWQYLSGRKLSRPSAEIRSKYLRALPPSGRVWCWSLLSGSCALISLGAMKKVVEQLIKFPPSQHLDVSQFPSYTVFSLLFMGAAVAGIVEEAAFRGYMQVPIERRHGLFVAIIVVGIVFGLAHFTHSWMSLGLLPMYLVISAVYGVLANLTGSILPGVILHSVGNTLQDILNLLQGTPIAPPTTVWEVGTNLRFWLNCLLTVLFGILTIIAYRKLLVVVQPTTK